ncbi:MAG TPA: hypothetical protein VFV99_03860 [Kofleriaceae bacterium]|nr:hypothetical protein [Kofleriaceae bacterium]
MATRHFCTFFDKNYLSRGLALYESLRAHAGDFRWYVLCLDDEAHRYLSERALPEVVLVKRSELEAADPALAATRPTRSLVEYYFTITPAWVCYVLATYDLDIVTYVDADFRFFSSPEPLFTELGDKSVGVVEHRFPPARAHLEKWGRFNVGWLSFRNDEQGKACAAWWRERCIEWCYDRIEGDKFADQKYLEQWPRLFSQLAILQHKGVSVAPWNLEPEKLRIDAGRTMIDDQPLICFHYHGFKHVVGPLYETGLRAFGLRLDDTLRTALFAPYLTELLSHEARLARAGITKGHAKTLRLRNGGLGDLRRRATNAVGAIVKRTGLWART